MSIPHEKVEWELPHLKEAYSMQEGSNGHDFWSVKFYPYSAPGVPHMFAIVGGRRILVCSPPDSKEGTKFEVLQLILDDEVVNERKEPADHFACAWSKDLTTGAPLLCVAGNYCKIKVLDATKGEWLRTIIGHGGQINDLAVCPTNPSILASASDDHTVRIWSLDTRHIKQPCTAILEGYGHTDRIQSISFHSNGRYLLSTGVDRMINLWTLPVFSDANTGKKKPIRIFQPHFSTSEIHHEVIDCVMWYGDLIFSKAERENTIIMWTIDNFDSSLPPPEPSAAPAIPVPFRDTRSAFSTVGSSMGYTSHLKLKLSESDIMFMRFSIFHGSETQNPVLAFCDTKSKVLFWDLTRFREYWNALDTLPGGNISSAESQASSSAAEIAPRSHPFLHPFQHRNRAGGAMARLARGESPAESASSNETADSSGTGKKDWVMGRTNWKKRYDLGVSYKPLDPHGEVAIKQLNILGRQVAWSADGKWCVVVSSWSAFVLLERWEGR